MYSQEEGKSAFEEWLKVKREQRKKEAKNEQQQQQEKESAPDSKKRSKREAERAFKKYAVSSSSECLSSCSFRCTWWAKKENPHYFQSCGVCNAKYAIKTVVLLIF